jgi:hypothetical protein
VTRPRRSPVTETDDAALDAWVRRQIEKAAPLSAGQKSRLAVLLQITPAGAAPGETTQNAA